MSEFEDNLWAEVLRERGDELARAGRPGRRARRLTRPQLLTGTTVGAAAVATAAALLLSASTSPPAFAVSRNPDGTVTVKLLRPSGVVLANKKLAAMGVPAQIAADAKAPPTIVCPRGVARTVTFDPARIHARRVLVIIPGRPMTVHGAPLKLQPGPDAIAIADGGGIASGNSVVRTLKSGGTIRTHPGDGNSVIRMSCP